GHVGDPLQVQADMEYRHQEAEICGHHRSLKGQEVEDPSLDAEIVGVDLVIPGKDHLVQRRVLPGEVPHGELEEALGGRGHGLNLILEIPALVAEVLPSLVHGDYPVPSCMNVIP